MLVAMPQHIQEHTQTGLHPKFSSILAAIFSFSFFFTQRMYTQNLHTIQHPCATALQLVPSFRQHLIDGRHLIGRPSHEKKRPTLRWNDQKTTPTSVPCCSCAPVRSPGNTSNLRTCQAPQEILRFLGPSAADHHKPRTPFPRHNSGCVLFRQCLPVCPINMQRRDHGGVYGQLAATKQRQTLHDDFQTAYIASVGRCDARCVVVAQSVEWTAIKLKTTATQSKLPSQQPPSCTRNSWSHATTVRQPHQ